MRLRDAHHAELHAKCQVVLGTDMSSHFSSVASLMQDQRKLCNRAAELSSDGDEPRQTSRH